MDLVCDCSSSGPMQTNITLTQPDPPSPLKHAQVLVYPTAATQGLLYGVRVPMGNGVGMIRRAQFRYRGGP